MPSRKSQLATALTRTRITSVLRAMRGAALDEVPILAYHRILGSWNENDYPFDPELISASRDEFEWQMQYVAKHYSPITFATLIDTLDTGHKLPPRPIIVTFDDGFDDNFHVAFRVLKALNVPATFFISTGYINQPRTFWFDWLHYLAKRELPARALVAGDYRRGPTGTPTETAESIDALFAYVKRLPDEALREHLRTLESAFGTAYPASGFPQSFPLTWNQVREMSAGGMEFGSHTVSHPILANLTPEALTAELVQSKHHIEREIGEPVRVLSYPNGDEHAFDSRVIDAAKNAGYQLAASYLNGTNHIGRLEHYSLKRLHVERYTTRDDFTGMLAMPEILA
jgi:peptidoglycan/xylan/chitin deacetylase (PgdA/CDA1 family)